MPAIFISHTTADKPVVEPIAIALRKIFGEEQVFYDKWSIKPGDGIIDKMNEGLDAPDFVFFFVSEMSKNSEMVKLEWQNALMQSTSGRTKIIPIRVDGCSMPPILLQNVYIDLYTHGVESTIHQLVNLVQGNNNFSPEHGEYSNLVYSLSGDANVGYDITISASHFLDVGSTFGMLVGNQEDEVAIAYTGMSQRGFEADLKFDSGLVCNGIFIKPFNFAITPQDPLRLKLLPQNDATLHLLGVYKVTGGTKLNYIPKV